jgi:hypothetical protein
MKDEALKLALEALESCNEEMPGTRFKQQSYSEQLVKSAITAIKQALETPVQEPMTWVGVDFAIDCSPPEQRQWVGLTDEEIAKIYMDNTDKPLSAKWAYTRAIEQALKEKNNG